MSHAADAPARASIRLGPMLGRGGEGAVYAIEGRPDQVAKIYSTTPDERKVRKLRAMTKAASPRLLKVAAWPTALITKKGSVCGFVMPRVAARRGIHELYSPKSRSEVFPEVDFRFLVHTASNIARAFAVVHEHGHVLGDVNQSNLLVGPDGTAMLIDCDSFQITTVEVFFTCDVGVPLFTPPELHGIPFRGLRRTANHDCFGLAVLLFHLLFMGRHPFAGRYLGPGDMPIERAIAEYRFAYGPDRNSYRMERPPGTISLETMEPAFAAFTNAFGRAGSTGGRPDAKSWVATLERLKAELAPCQRATWHHYPRALRSCPWCEIEAQTGVRLFGQKIATVGTTGRIDVARLWEAMVAVADPGEEPVLPSERTWRAHAGARVPSGMGKALRKALGVAFVCAGLVACNVLATDGGIVLALLTYGIAFAVWPRVSSEKLAAANAHVASVRAEWEAVVAQWQREASRKVFAITLRALEKARDEVGDLTNERGRRLARLSGGARGAAAAAVP